MMPSGIPEGIPFNSGEVQQQNYLPSGGSMSNPGGGSGGNVFFRNIPSLPIASTPSVTLRHQPTVPLYARQSPPNPLSRQQPPNNQQPHSMNGGAQPSLNSSSASSFSGSPNNGQPPGPPELFSPSVQQQFFQQQQQLRGSLGKLPSRNAGQMNGECLCHWVLYTIQFVYFVRF